jgi:hypothetical protein
VKAGLLQISPNEFDDVPIVIDDEDAVGHSAHWHFVFSLPQERLLSQS